jgi:prepilin-type N-terminal cleavage/methylation domain-containing protein
MKNKKGFTLIELLAVVIVLAIIALIAVPQVLSVIQKSEKVSFKDSASGLLDAVEIYYTPYAGQEMTFDLSNAETMSLFEFKGKQPDGGEVYVNAEGVMAIKMYNSKYCAYKKLNEDSITVIDGNCSGITIK